MIFTLGFTLKKQVAENINSDKKYKEKKPKFTLKIIIKTFIITILCKNNKKISVKIFVNLNYKIRYFEHSIFSIKLYYG